MSDSSSDSEDGQNRFREVCDPTLSFKFNDVQETTRVEKNGQISLTDPKQIFDTIDDPRESFKLVNQVQKSVATLQFMKGCQRTGDYHPTRSKRSGVSLRTKNTETNPTSSFSPYLAKHLSSALDKNVKFETNTTQSHKVQETSGGPGSIYILKNVTLTPYDEEDAERDRKRRKKAAVKAVEKYSYIDSYNEKEVSSRCRSLAVTPDWLINNNHFPWPHPKNIRYLEEYVLKERHEDGTIVATSKTTSNQETSSSVMKTEKGCVGNQQVCKTKKKLAGKSSERTESAKEGLKLMNGYINGTLKSTNSGEVLAGNSSKSVGNDMQVVRKQKRKRGKRKKT